MSNEPKFYPIDPLDAYPEAVGTLDQIEHSDGALWVHLNGKRSKLVGMQSLAFLIGQLEQIRAQVFGVGTPVARYIQHWNMEESFPNADGEWVKVADHFGAMAAQRAQPQQALAAIDVRAEFERAFGIGGAVFFMDGKYRPCGFTQYAKDVAEHANTLWPVWMARAALAGAQVAPDAPAASAPTCAVCSDLRTIGAGTSCSPMIKCPECDGKSARAPGDDTPVVPTAGTIPPLDLSELGQALHDAAKWESLYRNEHATCTRLLDTMTGFRNERDALQRRMTGPVAIAMPELETEFPTWWENAGQFMRAGGGNYERTFAYGAYRDALAKVAEMNTTAAPDEEKP
jgi:hypothetical protein